MKSPVEHRYGQGSQEGTSCLEEVCQSDAARPEPVAAEHLKYHKENSGRLPTDLEQWLQGQIQDPSALANRKLILYLLDVCC